IIIYMFSSQFHSFSIAHSSYIASSCCLDFFSPLRFQ
ncbi:hypothetical protein ISN45_Aa03g015910, partial [Arabidopsis thaliana x Arabidopsis arenosa]